MTAVVLLPERAAAWTAADRAPLLRWLIFTGATVFAAILLWSHGLIRLMVASDRTYLSSVIALIYVGASLHCLWRTIVDLARRRCRKARGEQDRGWEVEFRRCRRSGGARAWSHRRPHSRSRAARRARKAPARLDQTLLLRSLADRLRGSNGFGAFASDTLMKLGLLGTIIGFIIMLAPIAGLDASDKPLLKSSMGLMSDGMAVAMYTTLAGLVGSILLKIQYYMLDAATAKVFSHAVTLTETRVVRRDARVLERAHDR